MAMMVFLRRRGAKGVLASMAAMLSLGACESDASTAATSAALTSDSSERIELAEEVSSFARLTSVRRVSEAGDYIDLELAPGGAHIALSHAGNVALSVLSLEDGALREVRRAPHAGYAPVWREDGQALGVRVEGQTSTAAPMLAYDLEGAEVAPVGGGANRVFVQDNAIVLRRMGSDASQGRRLEETFIAPAGDRYFEPMLSPNAEFVAFRGLSSGLYIYRVADGRTFMFGQGSHARFSPDGRFMVFERVVDDGHEVEDSTLQIVDLTSDELRYSVLEVDAPGARAPSASRDGVAFLSDGAVHVGSLRFDATSR